jgi:thioredoxin-like negative regulator of GroEL
MEKLATSVGMELIDTEELEGLKEFKKTDADTISEIVKVEVAEASQRIYASEGAKASALKFASESKIALLENDKKHLESSVVAQTTRIAELEARLKDVPTQIAAAVQAAQSSVTVNQDAVKK